MSIAGTITGSIVAAMLVVAVTPIAAAPAEDITPSDQCGTCHRDIYRMWRESTHATAMDNNVFVASFREVEAARGTKSSRVCLGCHAPMAEVIGDSRLERRISWEGVTCDFCHSLVSVEMSEGKPVHRVDVGPVKRGPIRGAESTGHDVAYSGLYTQSIICAPCHEYTNRNGTPVMSTYSEWESSQAAERGETCQTCHMPVVEADVVDPRIKRESGAAVNLHGMPGGHSLEQLHKALGVSIVPERSPEKLFVTVSVRNKGAGHAVPTGMPGRQIIMELRVESTEGRSFVTRRTFGKDYEDSKGKPITSLADIFLKSIRLHSDTRIGVDEMRTETFDFALPSSAAAYITVTLNYEHAPLGPDADRTWMTFFSERRMVRAEP